MINKTKKTTENYQNLMQLKHTKMLLIRRFEEKAGQSYGLGQIGGFCHLYIGQEAVVVGLQMCIRDGDQVITTYRDHGHMLACGMSPDGVMAELYGRTDGYSKGKGGSMHMFSKEANFLVGTVLLVHPFHLELVWHFQTSTKNKAVTLTYFGDGAANQGQVYESFNMAKLWELPCIYVIENNRYAMGTSVQRSSAQKDLSQRGISFGIEGEQVNGMDIESVIDAGKRAVTKVRNNGGPYILEMLTYRYRGHSMSDPAQYRTRDEVKEVREHSDPIESLKNLIIENNFLTEDKLQVLNAEIKQVVDQSAQFAADSPLPDPSELFVDVYQLDL